MMRCPSPGETYQPQPLNAVDDGEEVGEYLAPVYIHVPFAEVFGRFLREARGGLTQPELVDRMNSLIADRSRKVNQATVSGWETDRAFRRMAEIAKEVRLERERLQSELEEDEVRGVRVTRRKKPPK